MEKTLKVCIDPGHGGSDPGATNGSKHEAVATLAIAKKLGDQLKARGVQVVYTRTKDKSVTLGERCRIANADKVDAFVSIHLNSAANKDAHGIETWRYEKVGATTKRLAEDVQTELIAVTGARNRGVKTTTTLYVLKHTVASAILVECGFISNREESLKLFTDSYQAKIAEGIAIGVIKALQK